MLDGKYKIGNQTMKLMRGIKTMKCCHRFIYSMVSLITCTDKNNKILFSCDSHIYT